MVDASCTAPVTLHLNKSCLRQFSSLFSLWGGGGRKKRIYGRQAVFRWVRRVPSLWFIPLVSVSGAFPPSLFFSYILLLTVPPPMQVPGECIYCSFHYIFRTHRIRSVKYVHKISFVFYPCAHKRQKCRVLNVPSSLPYSGEIWKIKIGLFSVAFHVTNMCSLLLLLAFFFYFARFSKIFFWSCR